MKVRWRDDSLRLRITPDELAALQAGEPVTETAGFPGGWSVTLGSGSESALGALEPGALHFTLSADALQALSQPETEGVYFATERYKFFVEKDFPCAHPRPPEAQEPQEETQTFAPPTGFAQRHRSAC
jgi:hypothetical protein